MNASNRFELAGGETGRTAGQGALLAGLTAEAEMFEYLLRALPAGTWVLRSLTLPGIYGDLDALAAAHRVIVGAGGNHA